MRHLVIIFLTFAVVMITWRACFVSFLLQPPLNVSLKNSDGFTTTTAAAITTTNSPPPPTPYSPGRSSSPVVFRVHQSTTEESNSADRPRGARIGTAAPESSQPRQPVSPARLFCVHRARRETTRHVEWALTPRPGMACFVWFGLVRAVNRAFRGGCFDRGSRLSLPVSQCWFVSFV